MLNLQSSLKIILPHLFFLIPCIAFAKEWAVHEFNSVYELIRKLLEVSDGKDFIPFVENIEKDGLTVFQIIDKSGNEVKKFVFKCGCMGWNCGVEIDYKHRRVIEIERELILGATPDIIRGVKSRHYKVYNANGQKMFEFEEAEISLLPYSKEYFLGSTEGEDLSSAGYCVLIDTLGKVAKTIKGIDIPSFKDSNVKLFILGDRGSKLWGLDLNGEVRLQTSFYFNEKVTISNDNLICATDHNEIVLLDSMGLEQFRFQPYVEKSSGLAVISKLGDYVFFDFGKSRNRPAEIYRDGYLGLFDIKNRSTLWSHKLIGTSEREWGIRDLGISKDGRLSYVWFSNDNVRVYDFWGTEIFNHTFPREKRCYKKIRFVEVAHGIVLIESFEKSFFFERASL